MSRERQNIPKSRRLELVSPHFTRGVEMSSSCTDRGFQLAEELVENGTLAGVRRPSKKQGKSGINFFIDYPIVYNNPTGETIKIPIRVVTTHLGFNFIRNKYSELGQIELGVIVIINNSFTDQRLKEIIGEQAASYRHKVLKERAANAILDQTS